MRQRLGLVFLAMAAFVTSAGLVVLASTGGLAQTPEPVVGAVADPTATVAAGHTASIRPSTTTRAPMPKTTAESSRPTAAPTLQNQNTPTLQKKSKYVFPVGGCHATASRAHHDYPAADIFTHVGCKFVSPVDGRIDEVSRVDLWNSRTNVGRDRGGLSVSVIGVDGVRYYGSHLSAVNALIRPGLQVHAGQVLGLTGKTGSARNTPAHLHFGISWPTAAGKWWIRRGAVAPQPYLYAWRIGRPTSPARAVARARTAYGVDHGCRSYC
ncbi:MAG TPA: peptidoglycan DD-metalloendopeptidase family protein [Kribbella sp.]|jgi:murein DD-endopeptidase MepM/ murein hydrolase activator NlpD